MFKLFRSAPSSTHDRVVDLNRYRTVSWLQRLGVLAAYITYAVLFLNPYGGDFMSSLLVFILLWAVCMNPRFKTSPFVRHHALQGFIWVFLLNALLMLALSGYQVLNAGLGFVPFLQHALTEIGLASWLMLIGVGVKCGGLVLAMWDAACGQQRRVLWLATEATQRLVYRS
jgi:uncharacterized membrane protein